MTEREVTVTILFADVSGSTALYEQSGNMAALAQISQCLEQMAATTVAHGGQVIRSKGDDLLCTFDQPVHALWAATEMCGAELPHGLRAHIGIHHGPVIHARGDIFSDAVNVASRIQSLANPGEILASEDFVESLPVHYRGELRLMEQRIVKGKQQPMGIYRVLTNPAEATEIHVNTALPTQTVPLAFTQKIQIELSHGDVTLRRTESDRKLVLGRSSTCDLIIKEPCVSREHATLAVFPGQVLLDDRSSTGTYVLFQGERPIHIRRETIRLVGSGLISLGRTPKVEQPNLIRFREIVE